MNLNHTWGTLIVEELARLGVERFCISPGSRSTPLALAAARNPRVRLSVHFDERGMAYFALGCAKASKRPTALICTSGTAAANYFPAVIEASMSCTPLIVLTADRPPELLDTGANQAIDQIKLFGDYIRWHTSLPCPDENIPPRFVLTTIDQAVYRARSSPAGPVHINCMFREPLMPDPSEATPNEYLAEVNAWTSSNTPYTSYAPPVLAPPANVLDDVACEIASTERGLLIIGVLNSPAEIEASRRLAQMLQWPLLADIASGLRQNPLEPHVIRCFDLLLVARDIKEWGEPEVILQLDAPITSKRVLQAVEARPPRAYTLVAPHAFRRDPVHRVTRRVQADIASFCNMLAQRLSPRTLSPWAERLSTASAQADEAIQHFLSEQNILTEPGVARLAAERAPKDGLLVLGNSMPIRDTDMFAPSAPWAIVNRGASGIDGTLATAVGVAVETGQPTTVLLGDLALLHDLASLALLRNLKTPFAAVVVNNDGGGIFSFLSVARETEHFERLFATPHGLGFEYTARMFGIRHRKADSPSTFAETYLDATRTSGPTLIEVKTDRAENARVHQAIQEAVTAALKA